MSRLIYFFLFSPTFSITQVGRKTCATCLWNATFSYLCCMILPFILVTWRQCVLRCVCMYFRSAFRVIPCDGVYRRSIRSWHTAVCSYQARRNNLIGIHEHIQRCLCHQQLTGPITLSVHCQFRPPLDVASLHIAAARGTPTSLSLAHVSLCLKPTPHYN